MNKTIAIIGAGPAGAQSAYLLSKEGFEVHLFEKQPLTKVGTPVQCTGIVSKNFGKMFSGEELKQFTFNEVKGAYIKSKNECLELRTEKVQAHIICRIKFDNFLIKRAKKEGATFHPGHAFVNFKEIGSNEENQNSKNQKKYSITFESEGKEKSFVADYLIGADGPNSRVAKKANLFGERKFWLGAQAVVKGKFDPEMVEVHVGEDYPNFFAWLVPENENVARIGVAAEKNSRNLFDKIMKKLNLPLENISEMQGGVIPQFKLTKTQKDNIYLIGDAAMMTKQTTGGGIVMSLIASECLRDSIITGKSYEKLWKKRIYKDLKMTRFIRRFLNKLGDEKYDKLISRFNNSKNRELLKEIGDMDFPSRFVAKMLLKDPGLLITTFF
jgi:digeranylgeranylglycerophospholipid reductase